MKPSTGKTMYVVSEPDPERGTCIMNAIKGEGMPTYKKPSVRGNLFLVPTIEFPDSLTVRAQRMLRSLLPPPMNKAAFKQSHKDVEVHNVMEMDPISSCKENRFNMLGSSEGYEEDEHEDGHPQRHAQHWPVQCPQQ